MSVYGDISPRTAAYAAKELLKRGLPYLILEKFGQSKPLPGNSSKTMTFRRYNALDATPSTLAEGITPDARPLTMTNVTATLAQYGSRIQISDVIIDTHEDPVLTESVALLGEQAAQMIEKMRFGVLKAGTNVAPGFIGLTHPDLESDIRNMEGFVPAERYGSITPFENELGKVEDVRYLTSTIFEPFPDAGGDKGAMLSSGGVKADVYPVLYLAANAYGTVALKGMYAVTPMIVNPKPSDSDPMGQRGHASWKSMQTAVILNDAWMVRVEVGATA